MRPDLYIDGRWRAGAGATFTSENPATGETVWTGAGASGSDVADACAAARAAFPAWSRTPLEDRIAIVRTFAQAVEQRAAAFAEIIARETGKAHWDS